MPSSFRTTHLPPILERNLRALEGRDPELAERLRWPVDMSHLDLGNERPSTYRWHMDQLTLIVPDGDITGLVKEVPEEGEVLLFGLGLGEIAVHLVRTHPELNVIAWDRDPALVRATLTRRDLSAALRSGKLRLCMAADLIGEVDADRQVIPHPVLADVYEAERMLLEQGASDRRVALGMGGFVVDDIAGALRDEGLCVVPLELSRWSEEELSHAIETISPELVVSVNYTPGLSEFCAEREVPLVSWQVDSGTDAMERCTGSTSHAHIYTFQTTDVPRFQSAGFENVEYLPVAARKSLRHPRTLDEDQQERYGARLSFVGSSLVQTANEYRRKLGLLYGNWHPDGMDAVDELESVLDRILAEQHQDYTRFMIPELLEEHLGHFVAAVRRTVLEDPVLLVGEMAAAMRRRQWVSQLGPLGIQVWGDAAWREVETSGAHYRGAASRREELSLIYSGEGVHVDVARLYQRDSISQRVFDVLACGGFLIAEHSEALEQQFEVGEEIVTYRQVEELEEKVRHYLDNPDEARAIADRGMAAVRDRHTMRLRIQHMLAGAGRSS